MSDSDGSAQPGDTMRERANESRLKLWILMEANRWFVAGAILLAVFASLLVLGVLDPSPLQQYIGPSDDAVDTVFQGFVGAIITGVTLVVTLNQLVLSQELGPVGDQRSRMEGAMEFRREIEDALDVPTAPPEPASFMQALLDETKSRANALADAVESSRDEELKDEIRSYVDGLTGNAERGERHARRHAVRDVRRALRHPQLQLLVEDIPRAEDPQRTRGRPHRRSGRGVRRHHRIADLLRPVARTLQDALLPVGVRQPLAGHAVHGGSRRSSSPSR